MKHPPMKARADINGGVATIDIEHDIAQSYSRAVDPRAMKEARRILRGGTWAMTDADYGIDHPAERRTVARFTFVRQA